MNEFLDIDREGLLFAVRRSVRYHDHRQKFFTSVTNCATFVAVMFGLSSAIVWKIASVTAPWVIMIPGFLVSLLSGIVLVFRTADKSREHWTLRNEFIELEKKVICALDEETDKIKDLQKERLDIESREPKILRMLDVMCRNEICLSMGYEKNQMRHIPWYFRWFSAFCSFENNISSLKPMSS